MLSADFLNVGESSHESQKFVAVGLTGTTEKFNSLLAIVRSGVSEAYIPGIFGCFQFEGAGHAPEPVTADSVYLMLGKQEGQRNLLIEEFDRDTQLRDKYVGQTLLLSSNDINTAIEETSLTKSPLQKESKMDIFEYSDLITASLKYLAKVGSGEKVSFSLAEMQSDWKLINKCLDAPWSSRVFLPIDYQSIDAFDPEELTVSDGKSSLTKKGPTIAVIHRAYATLELDFRGGNKLAKKIVDTYLRNNWTKPDFTPERYPLGIRQKELLKTFAQADQHVLISDHIEYKGINLKEIHVHDEKLMLETLDRIESMMNGFSQDSLEIARAKYVNMKSHDENYLYVVTRKPGDNDRVERRRLPKAKF